MVRHFIYGLFSYRALRCILRKNFLCHGKIAPNVLFLCFFISGIFHTTNNPSKCYYLSHCFLSMFCQPVNCSHTSGGALSQHSCARAGGGAPPAGVLFNMAAPSRGARLRPEEWECHGRFMTAPLANSDVDGISLNTECQPVWRQK